MQLLEELNGKIKIYEYLPDPKKARRFKQQEFEKIDNEHRILKATTNDQDWEKNIDSTLFITSLIYKRQSKVGKDDIYRIIQQSSLPLVNQQAIIESYIHNENYANSLIPRVVFYNYEHLREDDKTKIDTIIELSDIDKQIIRNLKAFIYTQNYEKISNGIFCSDGIINLPESLYVYDRLLKGNLRIAESYDITEQLKLFTGSNEPVETFEVSGIKNLDERLGANYYEKFQQQVKDSQKVLTLIREAK